MLSKNIALVGLSGVGKSTFIDSINTDIQLQILSASELIKTQKKINNSHDELRFHNINDNQLLLIEGFKQAKDATQQITILDGHTVIETPNGLTEISSNVFREIEIQHFVFLIEEAGVILQRRTNDSSRKRSGATLTELDGFQRRALEVTTRIALELRVPVTIITPEKTSALNSVLSSLAQNE